MKSGAVAHPGERFNGIEEVASSSLASSTNHNIFLVGSSQMGGLHLSSSRFVMRSPRPQSKANYVVSVM